MAPAPRFPRPRNLPPLRLRCENPLRSLRPRGGRNARAVGSDKALLRDVGPTVGGRSTGPGDRRLMGLLRGDELLRYVVGDRHRREYFAGQGEALRHLGGSWRILGTWTAGLERDDERRRHDR